MLWKENHPSTTKKSVSIVANTGRLMQRSAIPRPFTDGASLPDVSPTGCVMINPRWWVLWGKPQASSSLRWFLCDRRLTRGDICVLHTNLGALLQPGLPGEHDDFTGPETIQDLLSSVFDAADLHLSCMHNLILGNKNLRHSGKIDDSLDWHDGRRNIPLQD